MSSSANVRSINRTPESVSAKSNWQDTLHRWFLPQQEVQMVAASQSKGIFLPYPLIAILTTVGALVLSGIIGLYVQVSNLSTTMLLRDADQRAANQLAADKLATLQVYLQNDRERIIKLEAEKDSTLMKRR